MDAVPLPDGEPAGPEPLTEDEVARYVVAAAVWAPSVHNTQPGGSPPVGNRSVSAATPSGSGGRTEADLTWYRSCRACWPHCAREPRGTVRCCASSQTMDGGRARRGPCDSRTRTTAQSERVRELARWAPAPDSARADGVPPTSYLARAEHTDPDFPGRDFAHGRGWGLPPLSTAPPFRSAGRSHCDSHPARDAPADWIPVPAVLQRTPLTTAPAGRNKAEALRIQPLAVHGWRRTLPDTAPPRLADRTRYSDSRIAITRPSRVRPARAESPKDVTAKLPPQRQVRRR